MYIYREKMFSSLWFYVIKVSLFDEDEARNALKEKGGKNRIRATR